MDPRDLPAGPHLAEAQLHLWLERVLAHDPDALEDDEGST